MDIVSLKIEGLAELQAKLEELPLKLARRILRRALRAAGDVWKREMELRVARATGFLAQHIGLRLRIRGDELAGAVSVGPLKQDYPARVVKRLGGRSSTISAASVARYLEFGTSKMRAHPFIRQSFEAKKSEALDQFVDGAKVGFNEALK